MNNFITGLQFLTRIQVAKQSEWSPESFGRSVKYFPLIGAILGIILVLVHHVLAEFFPNGGMYLSPHVLSIFLIISNVLLTGGLTCDGFMDTMDGIFSGRSKDRMLEIMKDSRIGANGVMAFVLLAILKWSLIMDIPPQGLPTALFMMPLLGRFAMVIGITVFPYARPDGIGKAFAQYAGKYTLCIATILTLLFVIPLGKQAIVSLFAVIIVTLLFSSYVKKLIGGLTGDIYGAITEITEIVLLLVFLY
ncbi:adenosylcobinamide-GDP ribazoletransferase [Pelosinus propionicus]|uniref:Adenosylcobinamide-GDP ribazoletransferase n=1 Tax=Pelosinus propionicus DSM 13327 TaxID=1123291 RepID=A0A1I4H8N4_9FIRM|nr:adenosylcobinamide-GDP ribazoletransferase [Pelosinus propionicus]SFL38662.1 cobalamin-5'-phosphate synthase [Pelosinus propionicus DSM 13327]